MKIPGMKRESRLAFLNPVVFLLAAVCAVILLYSAAARPFYTAVKVNDVKKVYRQLSEMNLAEISIEDEETEEILQGFSKDKFEIIVTDEEYNLIYESAIEQEPRQKSIIERCIIPYEEQFEEEPRIHIRRNEKFSTIRLRGLLVQRDGSETETGGDGQNRRTYYVYIRLVIRSAGTVILYTTRYLWAAACILFLLGYLLLRVKEIKLAFVPARVYEEEMYKARYGEGRRGGGSPEKTQGRIHSGEKKEAPEKESGDDRTGENERKAQQEFVASVSHELKTPLAVISGQMEMLQSMGDRIDQNYYFTSIREEIDKMSKLVSNLLDLTIMEHQMEEMELSEVDFSVMIRYMTQKYDALFQQNGILFSSELEEGCSVLGNRTYLEQAVNNYIMNAFQHTPRGRKIRITLARENKNVRLSVSNEGSHIPPEELDRIWRGFYKEAGNSRTNLREFRNAGLGLYFVKKIAEIHCGRCGARNIEDGVEFWLTLPLITDFTKKDFV